MSIENLLGKFFLGKQDKAELQQLEQWKQESADNLKELQSMQEIWNETDVLKGYQSFDTEAALDRITQKLNIDTDGEEEQDVDSSNRYYLKAALLLLVSITGLFIYRHFTDTDSEAPMVFDAKEKNMMADLPDGTVVTLQEGASIDYSQTSDEKRIAILDGNAYFDVESDVNRPFVVETVAGDITVVGTEFSVQTIGNKVEIYVAEGHVRYAFNDRLIDLYQGDIATYKDESLVKYTINDDNYLSWTKGELIFVDENIVEVFKDLERHYQKKIKYAADLSPALLKCKVNTIFKNQTLDEVLQELSHIVDLKYTRKNKEIIIDGIKKC